MTTSVNSTNLDPRAFRRALGNFATGVTIITARSAEGVHVGVTASSFSSLSMAPPLVMWSSIKDSPSCAIFESAAHFAVNILASDQLDMSNHFARQQEDKFSGVEWEEGLGGAPIFSGCAGRFQCETYDKVDGGDHWIFIGKVIAFDDFGRPPLCFHQGSYSMVFSHPGSSPQAGGGAINGIAGGRMSNHAFFLMLQAVRAYQDAYQPKLETLGLSLIESRTLLVMNDLSGLNAEQLGVHVNSPLQEIEEALASLSVRGMVAASSNSYVLTADGQAKANQCWDLADAHAVETFTNFGDEQVEHFKDVLQRIISQ